MYFFYLASYVYNVIATHTIENNYNIFVDKITAWL